MEKFSKIPSFAEKLRVALSSPGFPGPFSPRGKAGFQAEYSWGNEVAQAVRSSQKGALTCQFLAHVEAPDKLTLQHLKVEGNTPWWPLLTTRIFKLAVNLRNSSSKPNLIQLRRGFPRAELEKSLINWRQIKCTTTKLPAGRGLERRNLCVIGLAWLFFNSVKFDIVNSPMKKFQGKGTISKNGL